jgi:hypothetical protein
MKLKTVTAGKTPVVLAAALALMAQSASSEERNIERQPAGTATAIETIESLKRSVEIELRAYVEALSKRLSEELAREIEALNAARVELAIAEVPTRG